MGDNLGRRFQESSDAQTPMTRKEIARGADELMKAAALVGEMTEAISKASERGLDAESMLLRIRYVEFMYDDFIFRMKRLALRAEASAKEADKAGNELLAASLRTSAVQAEQMQAQAEADRRTAERLEDALTEYAGAERQGEIVGQVSKLKSFQDKLRKGAGSNGNTQE